MIAPEEFMTWLRRAVRLIPVVILFVLATSCDNFFVSESAIQSVTVTPTAILLEAGATPADAYTKLISTANTVGGAHNVDTTTATWTSSNTGVVTVVASGASGGDLTAAGTTGNVTATVTATDGGQSGSVAVLTYTGAAPTSISINIPGGLVPGSIAPGQTFQLTASAALNSNPTFVITNFVSWASSDTAVATVNATGFVSVLSTATVGTTFTVTATANFGAAAPSATATGTSTTFTII
jgi:Bacterial Ig-like domain (group 2)